MFIKVLGSWVYKNVDFITIQKYINISLYFYVDGVFGMTERILSGN